MLTVAIIAFVVLVLCWIVCIVALGKSALDQKKLAEKLRQAEEARQLLERENERLRDIADRGPFPAISLLDEIERDRRVRFTCPSCGAVSHNPRDAAEGYCGRCHQFFDGFPPTVLPKSHVSTPMPPVKPPRKDR
jgi:predicted RNA-binding Zn-ribbon protein involved in translation (DUF1610 family)